VPRFRSPITACAYITVRYCTASDTPAQGVWPSAQSCVYEEKIFLYTGFTVHPMGGVTILPPPLLLDRWLPPP
jgi:hypothetical protein